MDDTVRDELEIRNLVARYADSVLRNDFAAWAETWAPDGEWHLLGQVAQGREAAVKRLEELMSGIQAIVQIPAGGVIELDGDRGTGRWTITEHGKFADGSPVLNIGTYDDEYRRVDGKWRFQLRRFSVFYMGPPDLSGHMSAS